MSNTTRHISKRRPPVSTRGTSAPVPPQIAAATSNKVDTLRRLVAAGQYHVSPKYLAMKIFKASGLE